MDIYGRGEIDDREMRDMIYIYTGELDERGRGERVA